MSGMRVSACVFTVVDQRVIFQKEHVWSERKFMCVHVVDQRVISEKEHVWSESKCMCVYGSGSEGNISERTCLE